MLRLKVQISLLNNANNTNNNNSLEIENKKQPSYFLHKKELI
jgi:hypothetical protein